jgi:hypothetical protein
MPQMSACSCINSSVGTELSKFHLFVFVHLHFCVFHRGQTQLEEGVKKLEDGVKKVEAAE